MQITGFTALRPWLARIFVVAALVIGAFLLPQSVLAQPITDPEKDMVLKRAESLIRSRAYAANTDFSTWPDMVVKYKDRLDRADTVPSFSRVLNSLMNEFGISHFDIMTPRMAEQRNRSSMVGIGIRHTGANEPFRAGLRVDGIIEGGPAERAGLQEGDTILALDGTALTETAQLRGDEGSKLLLTVVRSGREREVPEQIEVIRGKFRTRDAESFAKIDDDSVFIRVPSFDTTYDRRRLEGYFRQAIGAKYLVIDLRNNGGGATTNLAHFLGMLLPRGTEYGTTVDKEDAERYKLQTGKDPSDVVAVAAWSRDRWKIRRNAVEPFTGKIAVLVNGGSASASEITAAALRELCDPPAKLVGSRTAGAVLVANEVSLPDGFKMMVPISEYVTIKGRRLEGNRLQPDVSASGQVGRKPEADMAVAVALRELKKE